MHRKPFSRATLLWVLALLLSAAPLSAAHLYAAGNGTLKVYEIAANGMLALRQTIAADAGPMAITPGARFLYTSPFSSSNIVQYSVQADGTLRVQNVPPVRGGRDMAIHPSGDYLYVADGLIEAVQAYSTDDIDGHLTLVSSFGLAAEAEHVAVDPDGEFVFGGQHYRAPGHVTSARVGPQGVLTVIGEWSIPSVTGRMVSDGRFVYVQGELDTSGPDDGLEIFSILRIGPDGSISIARTYQEKTGPLLALGPYLALAKPDNLYIYAVDRMGNRTETDRKPIQTFALANGRNCWANFVWVATDDGIVTYSFDAQTGKLSRIGKAMVNGITVLQFGIR